jgi:hypothetical protein
MAAMKTIASSQGASVGTTGAHVARSATRPTKGPTPQKDENGYRIANDIEY